MKITQNEINQWKDEGYVVMNNVINNEIILNAKNHIENLYNQGELNIKDFGSEGKLEFPSNTIFDKISLDENIISIVRQLLNTDEILLMQSDAWGKKGSNNYQESSNNDQRMHMDYGNNTFLYPSNWENPEAVSLIIYLSDIKETLGGTSCVPRQGNNDELYQEPYINMPGINGLPFYNDKETAEKYFEKNNKDIYNFRQKLYQREKILKPAIGDILFYRLDLWHRGTPVKKGKTRFVINLVYKKKECFWLNIWNPGWTKKMYYGYMEDFITNLSPDQRTLLGFPKATDKFWTQEKIEQLTIRYPKIDIKPYLNIN
jgi:ectoine hydroxylase-related dioxygenase (phytanoyl-CoA dioxygenase family)